MDSPEPPASRPRRRAQSSAGARPGGERLFVLRLETTFRPWQWTAAFLLILVADYLTGPLIHSAILFYFIPVGMAAWSGARWWSTGLALVWPPVRLVVMTLWGTLAGTPWARRLTVEDTILNCIVSVAFANLVWRLVEQERNLRVLRGMLPICGFCKRIRDGSEWQPLEEYITEHSAAVFSHTFCPECGERHYGEKLTRRGPERRG